jgi:hypothetical protein
VKQEAEILAMSVIQALDFPLFKAIDRTVTLPESAVGILRENAQKVLAETRKPQTTPN